MKQVHVECSPDELLVSKLGFSRKLITHHQGKSRVFHALGKKKHQLAMIDEDPGSSKTNFEKSLNLIVESYGIKCYKDSSGNKILILKGKLEDWIINICKRDMIKVSSFGLPADPDDLHDVINQRLSNFGNLIDELIKTGNPSIMKLKALLN